MPTQDAITSCLYVVLVLYYIYIYVLLNRYAEGIGTAAKFNRIPDLEFLTSTDLICSDYLNRCLRLLNFTHSPPVTSTFAGNCTVYGTADGHRLNLALLNLPRYIETNKNKSTLFVIDDRNLRAIDLETDEVITLPFSSDEIIHDLMLFEENLVYMTLATRVIEFNVNTKQATNLTGGKSGGKSTGLFEVTSFGFARALLLWRHDVNFSTVLVADRDNKRLAKFIF